MSELAILLILFNMIFGQKWSIVTAYFCYRPFKTTNLGAIDALGPLTKFWDDLAKSAWDTKVICSGMCIFLVIMKHHAIIGSKKEHTGAYNLNMLLVDWGKSSWNLINSPSDLIASIVVVWGRPIANTSLLIRRYIILILKCTFC